MYLKVYFILVLIIFLFFTIINKKKNKKIIFTCSTFFDFKDNVRWEKFNKTIETLQYHHSPETLSKIDKWVIVNEYSENHNQNWEKLMKEKYPDMIFIQKKENEKGQAYSLNMILKEIKNYDYWIHWEETWQVRYPFLEKAFSIMNNNNSITQLQFTFHNGCVNWLNVEKERIHCYNNPYEYCIIDGPSDNSFMNYDPYNLPNSAFDLWPLYSLLPSINRVKFYNKLGEFSEDPKLWPLKFEWDYARRWYSNGGKKAVLKDGPVYRPDKHMSTYE